MYFPKYLRAGFPIQIAVEILKNPNPVHFAASLKTPAREIDYQVEDTLVEGICSVAYRYSSYDIII